MYCNRCGSDKHFAAQCDAVKVVPKKEVPCEARPVLKPASQTDGSLCPACGTDLGAKAARKAYMREYMSKRREKKSNAARADD